MDRIDLRPSGPADRDAWGALRAARLAHCEAVLPVAVHDAASARDPRDVSGPIARTREAVGLIHRSHHAHLRRPEDVSSLPDLFTAPEARGTARQPIGAVHADAGARGAFRFRRCTRTHDAAAPAPCDRIAHDARPL